MPTVVVVVNCVLGLPVAAEGLGVWKSFRRLDSRHVATRAMRLVVAHETLSAVRWPLVVVFF